MRFTVLSFAVVSLFCGRISAQTPPGAKSLAPYVSSPVQVVERMLELARLKPGETVYDLGCGDGRVLVMAIERYQAKAVGVELSERLVRAAQENLKKKGFDTSGRVIHANLLDVDISDADVVTLYLMRDANETLRPKLEKSLRAGSRVISHDYEIRGWKASLVDRGPVLRRDHVIYVYEMPQGKR